jgi:hypothetical protein
VYLITCRTARGRDILTEDRFEDMEAHSHTSRTQAAPHGPFGAICMPAHLLDCRPSFCETPGPTHLPQSCGPAATCHHPLVCKTQEMGPISQRGPGGGRRTWAREHDSTRLVGAWVVAAFLSEKAQGVLELQPLREGRTSHRCCLQFRAGVLGRALFW